MLMNPLCRFVFIKNRCFGFCCVKCARVHLGSQLRIQKLCLSHNNTLWHLSLLCNYQSICMSIASLYQCAFGILWILCEGARQWKSLERSIRIMCWALLCSLMCYFLKIHLGLIDHQSQLRTLRKVLKDRAHASREEVKTQKCYDTAELQEKAPRDTFRS